MSDAVTDAALVALIGGLALVFSAAITAFAGRRLRREVSEINDAVNHKEHGMPTLVQRVTDQDALAQHLASELAAFREWHAEVLRRMASDAGIRLPPEPPAVEPQLVILPKGS